MMSIVRRGSDRNSSDNRESGQAIVILALGLAALLAMAALVIDGGNGFVQQRATQNAVDAAALAGATVMVKNVGDPGLVTGNDVLSAIRGAYLANDADFESAEYVTYDTTPISPVDGRAIPANAGGVTTHGSRTF